MRLSTTRRAWLAVAIFIVASANSGSSVRAADQEEHLHVVLLHTNDVHGQARTRPATWINRDDPPPIGGLPRLAAYVNRVRNEVKGPRSGVLLVDGGDWFQGTPEGLSNKGRSFVSAMSKVGYDAMAVGNHEFDHGIEPLKRMLADYRLPALCANVRESEGGGRVPWVEPWRIIEVAQLRIGIVGLLTPVTPSITHREASDLHFEDPGSALKRARQELGSQVDWILPITHLGVQGDRRLAKAHPDLDVIVGGHSHTYLKSGVRQGETLIVQAGSKAGAVGRLDLWFDPETKKLKDSQYTVMDLLDEPRQEDRNSVVDKMCNSLVGSTAREMSEPVGELLDPLVRAFRRLNSSPVGNLITDTMREFMQADVAVQNRGGIRCDLPKGTVTRRGLFELLPFGNHLVLIEISGRDLFACIRASVEGSAHTGLEVSGMEILYREGDDGKVYLADLVVSGVVLDREQTYRLVTNNFLAGGGDGYEVLKSQKVLREDPILLRELLEARFQREKKLRLPEDERYSRVAN